MRYDINDLCEEEVRWVIELCGVGSRSFSLRQAQQIHNDCDDDDWSRDEVNFVELHARATLSQEEVGWNEKLEQRYHKPGWDLIRWPEEEERIKHVKQAILMMDYELTQGVWLLLFQS